MKFPSNPSYKHYLDGIWDCTEELLFGFEFFEKLSYFAFETEYKMKLRPITGTIRKI